MKRKAIYKPPIKMKIWKQEGKLYFVERADLEQAIQASGWTDEQMRMRLGVGYSLLIDALAGKRIDGWSAYHIESGLMTKEEEEKNKGLYLKPFGHWI